MDAAVSVLAADCHPIYREGVARVVRQRTTMQLVGEVEDGGQAMVTIARLSPDVAVVDPSMPGLDHARLLAMVTREGLGTRVLLLASEVRPGDAYGALAAGARGYLSKLVTSEQLAEAIRRVAQGETVIATELQADLAADIRIREKAVRPAITRREREILELIARGLTAREIAGELHLSTATVKTHMLHVYDKLEVSERAAAVAQAIRRGLLD